MMFQEQIAWAPSVWFALTASFVALVAYLVLVPLKKNRGAKRLAWLLALSFGLLAITEARIQFGDWAGRYEVISIGFILIGVAFSYLAWSIWDDQVKGARKNPLKE